MGEHGTERNMEGWLGDEYIVMNGDTLTNVDISLLKEAHEYERVLYYGDTDHYAGTTYVNKKGRGKCKAYISGAYYLDIGSPSRLQKARRFYARHK